MTVYASCVPSGDQTGSTADALPGVKVIWRRPLPSCWMVQISNLPLRLEKNASSLPSGDQRGARSRWGSSVSWRRPDPSGATTKMSSWLGARVKNETRSPRGDTSGITASLDPWVTAGGRDRPDVAPGAGGDGHSPVGDPMPVRGPVRLNGVHSILDLETADRAGGDGCDPELAAGRLARLGTRYPRRGKYNLLSLRRPGRVISEIGEPSHGLSGGAHQVDAAAVAIGLEGDLFAVGRERGMVVVLGRVGSQVDRVLASYPLQEDVPVSGRPRGIDDRFPIGRKTGKHLRSCLIGQSP